MNPPPTVPAAPQGAPKHPYNKYRSPARGRRGRMGVRKELSAGGVAARQEDGVWLVALLMTEHKRGKVWVLPKGHVELDIKERVSDAAKREVEEEAGISDLVVKNQLGVTRFRFQAETAVVHKTVHYFLMTTNQKQLTPQADEGLIDAAWFPIGEAIKQLEYDTDQDIVQRAWDVLEGRPRQRRRKPPARRPGGGGGRQVRIRT